MNDRGRRSSVSEAGDAGEADTPDANVPAANIPDAAAAGRSGDPVAITRALVAIPSVNPEMTTVAAHAGEERVARTCAGWLESWGFGVEVVETVPGRPSVLARMGRGTPRTILNGHTDTVGIDGMTVAPFDPVVRDGRILGRGSCDMKAGLGAILAAARRLALGEEPFPGELLVVLTTDEEHASIGLRALLDRGLTGDRAVVTEPTSLAICPANKGFVWAHVDVRGRAAHGSRPDLGRDAIRDAGRILAALDAYELELTWSDPHPLLERGSIHAGTIQGGSTPSVYPASCRLLVEARTLPGEGPAQVMDRLHRVLAEARKAHPDLEATIEAGLSREAAEVPVDTPLVLDLEAACRTQGLEPRIEGMTAWVESAWFVGAGIPAVCFGPGAIGKAHSDDEFVPTHEVETAARVLETLVRGASAEEAGSRFP